MIDLDQTKAASREDCQRFGELFLGLLARGIFPDFDDYGDPGAADAYECSGSYETTEFGYGATPLAALEALVEKLR